MMTPACPGRTLRRMLLTWPKFVMLTKSLNPMTDDRAPLHRPRASGITPL